MAAPPIPRPYPAMGNPQKEPVEINYKLFDESSAFSNDLPDSRDRASLSQAEGKIRRRKVHFSLLALSIFLYMTYLIGKNVLPACRGLTSPSREMLNGTMHRIEDMIHGNSRNMSTVTDGKLPTHYTLPSGDKIPSIALGMC